MVEQAFRFRRPVQYREAAINIVLKDDGGPTRDCELVSLSPRADGRP